MVATFFFLFLNDPVAFKLCRCALIPNPQTLKIETLLCSHTLVVGYVIFWRSLRFSSSSAAPPQRRSEANGKPAVKSAWTRYAQGHMIQRGRPWPGRTMRRLCRGRWLAHARTHATRHTSTFAPFFFYFFFYVVNLQQPGGKGPTALLASTERTKV